MTRSRRNGVRLLAVDIDGTLLDSQGRLPPAHRDALAEAYEAGIHVVLATGRAHHFTQPVVDAVGIPVSTIVNNGAVARHADGRTALRHVLDRHVARAIVHDVEGFQDSVALVFDRTDARQIVYEHMDWSHPQRRGYYARNHPFLTRLPLAEALDEDPIQVMFNGRVDAMRSLTAALRALPAAVRFTVAITEYEARDFALVDVNGPGCSKGATLAGLAAQLGVTRDAVMAVGDNLNDLDMLDFAGRAVVMGNAAPPLRLRGFPIVAGHDQDGLAEAIRRYALADPGPPGPGGAREA